MKQIILVLSTLLPSLSLAVKFHCYSLPNLPVQVFEFSTAECAPSNLDRNGRPLKKDNEKDLGKNVNSEDGYKDILCSYQAACTPVEENAADEPSPKSVVELTRDVQTGKLKGSMLICKGRGSVDANGVISDANCPSPSRCQKDVLYNFGARSYSPGVPVPVGMKGAK